ncbi:MAG: hypothetical protein JSS29_15670 [Proteobacteria bacterium]|nr:hypothetical protein [Pseudomonadota bacterium]
MPALALVLIVGSALARTGDVAKDEFDVHLWQYNFTTKAMDETRFHVRNGEFAVEPSDAGSLLTRAARNRLSADVFRRLHDSVKQPAQLSPEGDLTVALKALDDSKSYGESPDNRVLSSPDGRYAALTPRFSRPVVVNVLTLETDRLQDRSDTLDIPMAWSVDSQRLAYAPSEQSGKIFVFDVVDHKRESVLGGQGRWIVALAWSADDQRLATLELANRRLHKTPLGLLAGLSGHPDFRNDLVLREYGIDGGVSAPLVLERNLTEQSNYDYWIQWR